MSKGHLVEWMQGIGCAAAGFTFFCRMVKLPFTEEMALGKGKE